MTSPQHPREIDLLRPSAARVYDLLLGGTHNYPVDRNFAAKLIEICPFIPEAARQNRDFLRRAVRYMATEHGIRQFIDIGSGIPTVENVHHVAHSVDPTARVVYADIDNEAIVTGKQLLQDEPNAISIFGDLRAPEQIFDNPQTQALIDFTQPVGLLMMAALHFIGDQERPRELVRTYLDRLAPGSCLAASHATVDDLTDEGRAQFLRVEKEYGNTANPATLRSKAEFRAFFDGLNLVSPGVTYAADWCPTAPVALSNAARPSIWAALGCKP